jgi:DNA invertase Pin-like site-specific DNA recombinase
MAQGDSKAKSTALAEVKATSKAVRDHEKKTKPLRTKRNRAIVKAAKLGSPATEIAAAAGIKQSYVSRVIRSGGNPGSGSSLDRRRDG